MPYAQDYFLSYVFDMADQVPLAAAYEGPRSFRTIAEGHTEVERLRKTISENNTRIGKCHAELDTAHAELHRWQDRIEYWENEDRVANSRARDLQARLAKAVQDPLP